MSVDFQISASDFRPQGLEWVFAKTSSQIVFLSEQPEKDLEQLAGWIEENGYKTVVRAFSDEKFWLDVPEAFIDFVIEAMTLEMAEYDV